MLDVALAADLSTAPAVVKRNAPSSTSSAAVNTSFAGISSGEVIEREHAVLAELDQAAFGQLQQHARARRRWITRSLLRAPCPARAASRAPFARSTHAGICTPSTTRLRRPVARNASAANAQAASSSKRHQRHFIEPP